MVVIASLIAAISFELRFAVGVPARAASDSASFVHSSLLLKPDLADDLSMLCSPWLTTFLPLDFASLIIEYVFDDTYTQD